MNRIEKVTIFKAPRARVWRALSDVGEFNTWFKVNLSGSFTPGATLRGPVTYPGHEWLIAELIVERVEPEHHLSFRWHPAAIERGVDHSAEPHTLVSFDLAEVPAGTRLSLVESGFDQLPPHRREAAFRMNERGWASQLENLARHVA
jgi:uncharacterized protein YndB with AHSA1/START domain